MTPANTPACRVALVAVGAALALAACTSSGSGASTPTSSTPTSTTPTVTSSSSGPATATTHGSPASSTRTSNTNAQPLDTAFVTKANSVCAKGIAYGKAHPFPYPNFDPRHPVASELPAIAAYYKKTPDVVAELIALPAPAIGSTNWRKVVSVLKQLEKNDAAQTSAAARANPESYQRATLDSGTIARRLRIAAAPAGLLSARSCVAYFTG